MFKKKDKENKKTNSMVDVGQESAKEAKNIFKIIIDGFKETAKTIKEGGDRSVKKMPTSSVVLIVLLLLLMLYFVISTIANF